MRAHVPSVCDSERRVPRDKRERAPGNDLLSHRVAPAVPSALEGLASLFGMGRGVSPPLEPPEAQHCHSRERPGRRRAGPDQIRSLEGVKPSAD